MADLFKEVLPSIMTTKEPVIFEDNKKDYVPYVINRALSYHIDCVLFANEMNMVPSADPLMQYEYYLNSIRARKRPFRKWQKPETTEKLQVIKEYYNYSNEKAREVMSILDDGHIDEMKKKLDKGGLNNVRSKRANRGNAK